jgi:hypothetical protein
MPDMPSPQERVTFPEPPDEQRRANELEKRLAVMPELCRIVEERAVHHASKALLSQGYWQEDWQTGKTQRLHELARVLGSVEFAAVIRGTPALRRLFSQSVPPPLPPRPRPTSTQQARQAAGRLVGLGSDGRPG